MLERFNLGRKNLFPDGNRLVYFDYQKKIAYFVPQDKEGRFRFYYNRLLIGVLIIGLAISFNLNPLISIGIGLVVYLLLTFMFYTKFLPSLSYSNNFDLNKIKQPEKTINKESRKKAILRIVLYLAFGVLLVLNAYDQNVTNEMLILSYAILVFCIFVSIKQALELMKK